MARANARRHSLPRVNSFWTPGPTAQNGIGFDQTSGRTARRPAAFIEERLLRERVRLTLDEAVTGEGLLETGRPSRCKPPPPPRAGGIGRAYKCRAPCTANGRGPRVLTKKLLLSKPGANRERTPAGQTVEPSTYDKTAALAKRWGRRWGFAPAEPDEGTVALVNVETDTSKTRAPVRVRLFVGKRQLTPAHEQSCSSP